MPESNAPAPHVRKAALTFIFVTVVLDMLALGIIIPVLPGLILSFKGGNSAGAAYIYGLFGMVFAGMQFFFAPILGAVSDKYGRRPLILLSNFGLGFDYVLMALAPSLAWLFVGRVIAGICTASFSIPSAYIADVTPPEKRAAGYGMLGAAFGLGFVVGPAFGGLLGSVSPRLPFWIAAGLSLANALYGFFILPESLPAEKRADIQWKKANPVGSFFMLRKHPEVLSIAAVVFLFYLAHEVLPSTWVLYTNYRYHWDTRTVGLTLAVVGIFSAVVQGGLIKPIVARLGEPRALLFGLLCGVIGFLIYGLAPTGKLLMFGIPFGALWGLASPAAQALITKRVDPSEQGRLQGALAGLRGISGMIGPGLYTGVFAYFIGGHSSYAAHHPLPGAPFLLAAALLGAALVLAAIVTRPKT
jgi:DHA1 family tetracycline resistance protein-like MFS transporter